jgi:hypothetical protein
VEQGLLVASFWVVNKFRQLIQYFFYLLLLEHTKKLMHIQIKTNFIRNGYSQEIPSGFHKRKVRTANVKQHNSKQNP